MMRIITIYKRDMSNNHIKILVYCQKINKCITLNSKPNPIIAHYIQLTRHTNFITHVRITSSSYFFNVVVKYLQRLSKTRIKLNIYNFIQITASWWLNIQTWYFLKLCSDLYDRNMALYTQLYNSWRHNDDHTCAHFNTIRNTSLNNILNILTFITWRPRIGWH